MPQQVDALSLPRPRGQSDTQFTRASDAVNFCTRLAIQSLREKGIDATDIAKILGVSEVSVYRYLGEALVALTPSR